MGIDDRKTEVRAQLDEHSNNVIRRYERRINDYLDVFNTGFTITETRHSYPSGIAASSYQLVINNTAIDLGDGQTPPASPSFKNTLSSGDRATLALAFFLAHLEEDQALADITAASSCRPTINVNALHSCADHRRLTRAHSTNACAFMHDVDTTRNRQ